MSQPSGVHRVMQDTTNKTINLVDVYSRGAAGQPEHVTDQLAFIQT